MIANELLTLQTVKVTTTEFTVVDTVMENMPGRDENRVGNRHDRPLVTASLRQPTILRGEVAVTFSNGAAGAFDEGRS